MIEIREESESDHAAVWEVQRRAFGGVNEADLVTLLRETADPQISLVAERERRIVGHIFFSPVTLAGFESAVPPLGLAPVGVEPALQNREIGSQLVRAGLDACRALGAPFVVVLGRSTYYPRFGFAPTREYGIDSEYPSPPESFMLQELEPGVLRGHSGTVRYLPAFAETGT